MINAIYNIIIFPVYLLIETVFDALYDLIGNAGLSVIAVSLVVNLLALPLYLRADRVQEETRQKQKRMEPGVSHIKKTFRGDEQYMMLSTYYRQNHYSPLHALRGAVSLLLQIPFFIAAYRFLSGLSLLRGMPFLMIRDLGAPDRLLSFGDIRLNLLPVLMTLLNVVSTFIYTRGAAKKEKIQAYGLAALFLILLYDSPAGLVLYWTCNQLFSVVKNLPHAFSAHPPEARSKPAFMHGDGRNPTCAFAISALFLTLLTGALIPSALIADSPLEFVSMRDFSNPAQDVFSTLCIAAGCFLFWGGVFYAIASVRGKRRLSVFFAALCGVSLVDYMAFGKNRGVLSSELVFDVPPSDPVALILINTVIVSLIICAVLLLTAPEVVWQRARLSGRGSHALAPGSAARRIDKRRRFGTFLLSACAVTFLVMSVLNIRSVTREIRTAFPEQYNTDAHSPDNHTMAQTRHTADMAAENAITPVIPLSRGGKNVIVFMLDRAISGYIPYIMQEKPELEKQFAGFVYYPNTLSHGGFTVFGAPALFGGYEYTVTEINKRKDERLVLKHNEALRVLPTLFSENGFDVTVCDPPFAGYRWIPDLSIYDGCEGVSAHITEGVYTQTISAAYDASAEQNRKRNLFCYSLYKASPLLLQPALYAGGTWHSTYGAADIPDGFLKAYSALAQIIPLTEIRDDASDCFLMLANSTPHEPALLMPPDYTIAPDASARAPRPGNGRYTLPDGSFVRMETDWQLSHYHVNMVSLLRIGEWLDWMRAQGVYDNTHIIIASDHGRHLGQFDDLLIDDGLDAELVNPLLMVKDFGADTSFTASMDFMTNADVPFLAADGVIENPVNSFTGHPLDGTEQKKLPQTVTGSKNWNTTKQHGNTFDTSDGHWYRVHDNIFKKENWERAD